jgi:two-component system, cell cycle response regulator DivK
MKKVLYIEDNAVNTMLMEMVVRNLGDVELTCAGDAEAGLVVANDMLPDIILMDIKLPGISGIDATRKLQQAEALRHIPVIVVSSDTERRTEDKAREAGCAAYLTKPLAIPALMQTLKDHLSAK